MAKLVVRRPDGSVHVWSHDFRDSVSGGIRNAPAQDVSSLFSSGRHVITLSLTDVSPNVYSTRPYFLRYSTAPAVAGTNGLVAVTPGAGPETGSGVAGDVAVVGAVEPVASAMGAMVGPEPVLTPTPGVAVAGTEEGPAPGRLQSQPETAAAVPVFGLIGSAVFGGAGIVLGRRWYVRRRLLGRPTLCGYLSVHDIKTNEKLPWLDLTSYEDGSYVVLEPLRLCNKAEPAQADTAAVARLWRDNNGLCSVAMADGSERASLPNAKEITIGSRLRFSYRRAPAAL